MLCKPYADFGIQDRAEVNNFAQLFEYKQWANSELLDLGVVLRNRLPAEDHESFARILNHTYVVDRIFASHLNGLEQKTYSSTNTEETPDLELLREKVRITDQWYVQYAGGLDESDLRERIQFRYTDGDAGGMARSEILLHLVMHGTYHRGAAGRILLAHGFEVPRDSLSVFLHQSEPTRRW